MTTYNFDELTPDELSDELFDELEPDGSIEKIRALSAAGCNVNQEMPLLVAVTANRLDMVKLLVEAGADVNKVDYDSGYETALFRAKYLDHQNIVEYLEPLTSPELREDAEQLLKINQSKKSKKRR